ncbi:phylloplanin-like [Bidens hawaiensis]|uniref:phylloplanin-like n=1 Tax=Bidens hawaiensis TaxID=980011 RepID=UPI00404B88C9
MKSIILITLLVVLVATQGEAQVTNVLEVIGNVSCTANASIVFNDAVVDLSCGGNVRGMAVTNAMGTFGMILSPSPFDPSTLLTSCKIILATPLSSCNSTLPSTGTIEAPLQVVNSTTILGILRTIAAPGKGILAPDD